MDATQIKTRHGLILEGVTEHALSKAGFTYRHNWQYDESAEVPDFFIPDSGPPTHVIEVHQTDARDSFRMKTLRAFTAVTEAKSHFGDAVVSVNILFGDPDTEVPQANVNALCGFFDVNIVPRKEAANPGAIISLEAKALEYASDEGVNVEQGVQKVAKEELGGIRALAAILKKHLPGAGRKTGLDDLWQKERERTTALGMAPAPGEKTYYKRVLLKSIFLSDVQFEELIAKKDPDKCSPELQQHLVATKLATITEAIDGDHYHLEQTFKDFLKDPHAVGLRELCKKRLDEEPAMKWFFEDIRDGERRLRMAESFFDIIHTGYESLTEKMKENLVTDESLGIPHRRCWIADLTARYLGVAHNEINRRLVMLGLDTQNLGNPFNQMSYKSDRFMSAPETHEEYVHGFVNIAKSIATQSSNQLAASPKILSERILALRIDGAVKLQKLNPLHLVLEKISETLRLSFSYNSTHNFLSDVSGHRTPAEKFYTFHLSNGSKKIIVNGVAVHDHNGDHKSKEWGARRRATLYRLQRGKIIPSEFQDALFVLDGDWGVKDVKRLYRSGWNRICRLGGLEEDLKDIFGMR